MPAEQERDGVGPGGARLTRRELVAVLGGITAAAAIPAPLRAAQGATVGPAVAPAATPGSAANPVAVPRLKEFRLSDVRLLDGPFLEAQRLDARYLMELEPDRMLHNFRVNAGLPPKAAVYGGWESQEPWVWIRCHGHTLGHYLSAAGMMYAATGDQRFKDRVDYIVAELRACQEASGSGLVCAFPDGAAQLENSVSGREVAGVPWYTMHKIFAGLRDAHLLAGNAEALPVLTRLTEWAWEITRGMTEEQFQTMLDREHGGMSEVLVDVHALTGEPRYLTLAQQFAHRALLTPLAEGRDTLDGLHSNTQIPKVIGFHRLYEQTGQPDHRRAAEFFWDTVIGRRTYVTGGNGDVELFFPPDEFAQRLDSAKTMETCCTHNLLRLTRALFTHHPMAAYADYYERALFNGILASQDPDTGMNTYFQATRPGYVKLYHTPFDSFWCCTGSGIENHAKYGDSIYFHSEHELYVNLFIPSTLTWAEKGLELTQTTRFPEEQTTRFAVSLKEPTRLGIRLRHPGWSNGLSVTVNGEPWAVTSNPGSYLPIDREWRDGDVVEVKLPMTLRSVPLPGAPDLIAFMYGPIVLAGTLGRAGISPGANIIRNERESGNMLNQPVTVPVLVGDRAQLAQRVQPDPHQALTFRTVGLGRPEDVTLVPYYRISHDRYNLYWKVSADSGEVGLFRTFDPAGGIGDAQRG